MADAGHPTEIYIGLSASPTDEIDGPSDVSINVGGDMLDVSKFFAAGWRQRIKGLNDSSVSFSGPYDHADSATAILEAAIISGADVYVQVLYDGTNGVEIPVLVESFDKSADVGGFWSFSCSLQGNGAVASVP